MKTGENINKWPDKMSVNGRVWDKIAYTSECMVYTLDREAKPEPKEEPPRFMSPIPGKFHLTEPLEGEFKLSGAVNWEADKLSAICCDSSNPYPYKVLGRAEQMQFRFPEYGPLAHQTTPPVDFPVLVNSSEVLYFSHFSEGYCLCFSGGKTSQTWDSEFGQYTQAANYSFVDIDSKFPEAWVKYVEGE